MHMGYKKKTYKLPKMQSEFESQQVLLCFFFFFLVYTNTAGNLGTLPFYTGRRMLHKSKFQSIQLCRDTSFL